MVKGGQIEIGTSLEEINKNKLDALVCTLVAIFYQTNILFNFYKLIFVFYIYIFYERHRVNLAN